jgi:hypothetical protein
MCALVGDPSVTYGAMQRLGILSLLCLACGSGSSETRARNSTSSPTAESPEASPEASFDGAPKRLPGYGRAQPVLAVALAPGARRLATLALDEESLRVYDVPGGRELCRIPVPEKRPELKERLLGIAFALRGDLLALETTPGTIDLYDTTSCKRTSSGTLHPGGMLTYAGGERSYPLTSTLRTHGEHLLVAATSGLVVAAWDDLVAGRFQPVMPSGRLMTTGGVYDASSGELLAIDAFEGYVRLVKRDGSAQTVARIEGLSAHDVVRNPPGTVAVLSSTERRFSVEVFGWDGKDAQVVPLEERHADGATLAWKDEHVVLVPVYGEMVDSSLSWRPHVLAIDTRTRTTEETPLPLTKDRASATNYPPVLVFDRPHAPGFLAFGNTTGGVEVVQLHGPDGAPRVVFAADWQGEPKATDADCEAVIAHLRTLAAGPSPVWEPKLAASLVDPAKQDDFRKACRENAVQSDIACFLAQSSLETLFPAFAPSPCGLGAL